MGEPVLTPTIQSIPLPPPDEIRRKAAEILQNPDYVLDTKSLNRSLVHKLSELFHHLFHLIGAWFDSLFLFSHVLWFLVVTALVVAAVALLVHVWITLQRAIRKRIAAGPLRLPKTERPQTPEDWERKAQDALGLGDFMAAVRYLFKACLLLLGKARKESLPRRTTNRELLVRYRDTPVFPSLRTFVDVIDWKWYSDKPCVREDYEACSLAYGEIRRIAQVMRRD